MSRPAHTTQPPRPAGVRLAGVGSYLPERRLTNADLERVMDTSDEWIVQRTGIHERRLADIEGGETVRLMGRAALLAALKDAGVDPASLDLLVMATMTSESNCPPAACRVAAEVGSPNSAAFDLSAACSGFVFGLNMAAAAVQSGMSRTAAVIGADTITRHISLCTRGRSTAILFGDGAGAVVLQADQDPRRGLIAQCMHTDGSRWVDLYIPFRTEDFAEGDEADPGQLGQIQMNGRAVFKFAVTTFSALIAETLEKAGMGPGDVDHYICHQSNARILESARERFGIPEEKLYVNISTRGNTVAASVPLCFDELKRAGRIRDGQVVMFLAFGAGLTWGSSLWRL